LFDLKPVSVDGNEVVPRKLFHTLFEPQVRVDEVEDVCIIRVQAVGRKEGRRTEATVEVIDYYDPATHFTAMQRMTGWHMSIVAAMMAKGEIAAGSLPLELAVPGEPFVREARKRGFKISERIITSSEVEQLQAEMV